MIQDNNRDGLSRAKRLEDARICQSFRVMEDDVVHLFIRALKNGTFIRYYNSEDIPDSYWETLYNRYPIAVLFEIKQFDLRKVEECFVQESVSVQNDRISAIVTLLEDWCLRVESMQTSTTYLLAKDLDLLIHKNRADSIALPGQSMPEMVQNEKSFYSALNAIRILQDNYETYLKDIEESGLVEPSLALLIAFVKNYSEIVSRYNKRWNQELPAFYIEKILQETCNKLLPSSTWLVLTTGEDEAVPVPAHTGFIAGSQPEEDVSVIYRSIKDSFVSPMRLCNVLSYYFDRVLLRKDLSGLMDPEDTSKILPQSLFMADASAESVSAGILIESPLLLLEEGERKIYLSLTLTTEYASDYETVLADPLRLDRAFYPEMDTEEGWKRVEEYQLVYLSGSRQLVFSLLLPPAFPPALPALRLLMNPEADYYPYKWALKCQFNRMKIRVEVSSITALDVQTVSGPADTSQPFYPFGPLPERGYEMVWGNAEMAQKPLETVQLTCNWLQLPVTPGGYSDRYKTYTPPLDNSSFRVRSELSTQKVWKPLSPAESNLFAFSFPNGKVRTESTFSWNIDADLKTDGQFRMILTEPEIGFGHTVFQKLFTDCMIRNSTHKKKEFPPEIPITPLMDHLTAAYSVEEDIFLQSGQPETQTAFYYIHPLMDDCLRKVALDHPASLFDGVSNKRNLLLGIERAAGQQLIRLFVDIAPFKRTLSRNIAFEMVWFIKQGSWNWVKLAPEALQADTTCCFLQTGLIELLLPEPVSESWLDEAGVCWLCAAFKDQESNQQISPFVSGFYLNPIAVELDTTVPGFDETQLPESLPAGSITEAEKDIPGVLSIRQIVPASGGCPTETTQERQVRVANRISHRDRAITRHDYEELAVARFREIGKAFCYHRETSGEAHPVVSVVVVPAVYVQGTYPLCENTLLWGIEDFLQMRTSGFVKVKVKNPFYEEITVRCRIELIDSEMPAGIRVGEVKQRINHCIAPWMDTSQPPVFNHSFGLSELKNAIGNSDFIRSVTDLVVVHRISYGMYEYRLIEYISDEEVVKPTQPGTILFPAKHHLIRFTGQGLVEPEVGIGELEIGSTFIIH